MSKHLTKEYIASHGYYQKWKMAQAFFDEYFIGKTVTFLYGYSKKDISSMTICLRKNNFQHLLGVKYKFGASAFWQDLRNNRIVWDQLDYCFYKGKNNNQPQTFESKMAIIDFLPQLMTSECRVASGGKYENLTVDALLRTDRPCLALGVKNPFGSGYFNTTLNIRPQVSNKGTNRDSIKFVYKILVSSNSSDSVIFDLLSKKKETA